MSELDDLAEDMATLLGAPCTLEDAAFNVVAYSGQSDVDIVRQRSIMERRSTTEIRDWFHARGIRESIGPLRIPAEASLGIQRRLCIPARHLNRAFGYFWLLDPLDSIPESRWPAALEIAELAGLLLSQADRIQTRLNLLYRDVISADQDTTRRASRELARAAGIETDQAVTCVMVEADRPATTALPPRREGVAWAEESPSTYVAIANKRVDLSASTATELLARLGAPRSWSHTDRAARVGVGPRVPSLDEFRRSRLGAQTALRIGRSMSGSSVTRWEDLGPLRVLAAASRGDLVDALIDDKLDCLVRDPELAELRRTALVYLDCAGSAAAASSQLRIHRQSLYHRLQRVTQITGLDLRQGRDRLRLHLVLLLNDASR